MPVAPQTLANRELTEEEEELLILAEASIDDALERSYSGKGRIQIDFDAEANFKTGKALLNNVRVRLEIETRYVAAGWVQVTFHVLTPGLQKAILYGSCLAIVFSDVQTPVGSENRPVSPEANHESKREPTHTWCIAYEDGRVVLVKAWRFNTFHEEITFESTDAAGRVETVAKFSPVGVVAISRMDAVVSNGQTLLTHHAKTM